MDVENVKRAQKGSHAGEAGEFINTGPTQYSMDDHGSDDLSAEIDLVKIYESDWIRFASKSLEEADIILRGVVETTRPPPPPRGSISPHRD